MGLLKFKENSIFTKSGRIQRDIDRFNKCIEMCDETIEIFADLRVRTIDEIREEKESIRLAKKEDRKNKYLARKIEKNITTVNILSDDELNLSEEPCEDIEQTADDIEKIIAESNNKIKSITEDVKQINDDLNKSIESSEAILNDVYSNNNRIKKNVIRVDVKTDDKSLHVVHNTKEVQISLIRNMKYRDIIGHALNSNNVISFMHNISQSGISYEDIGDGSYNITNPGIDSCFTIDLTNKDNNALSTVSIHPTLILSPHGKKEAIFNRVLKELGIKKCAPYDTGKDGTMTFIELNDGNVAACNIILTGKELSLIILYLEDKTIKEFKELNNLPGDEDDED